MSAVTPLTARPKKHYMDLCEPTLRLKTHGVENRRRFSESKIGTDFRSVCHAKTTPIFDSENRRRFSTPCVFTLRYGLKEKERKERKPG